MNTIMIPSKYQQGVYDFVSSGTGNAVIEARAGSGKTTTIVEAMKLLGVFDNPIFVAFNKHIADELKERGVNACTLNSFGWKTVRDFYKKRIKLNKNKTANVLKYKIFNMDNEIERKKCYKYMYAIVRLISLLKANTRFPNEDLMPQWEELSNKHNIEIPEGDDFVEVLDQTLELSITQTTVMDFDDQLFYPIYMDMNVDRYNYVFVDEAQDLNPVQIELIKRMGCGGRVIAVGDSYQAIYGFRGADPEAINNIINALDATVLPLSICYRCGKEIVKEAQKIVPDIEPFEESPEGLVKTIKEDEFVKLVTDDDYVLCRVTAPLVTHCLRMIREGKKATVKGRDIGDGLITLIDKIKSDGSIEDFLERLNQYESDECAKLARRGKDEAIMSLQDRTETIKALSHDANNVQDITVRIGEIFSDYVSGVVFCTIHKSKGLEAERIFILKPDKLPHPMAKKDWQIKQETNLKYVAITRAQKELYWVQ